MQTRQSKDTVSNISGQILQQFCLVNDWTVLNGRMHNDNLGEFTRVSSMGSSIIDLSIVNFETLKIVESLEVREEITLSDLFTLCLAINLNKYTYLIY